MGQSQQESQGQFPSPRAHQLEQPPPDGEDAQGRRRRVGGPAGWDGMVMVSLSLMGGLGHERFRILNNGLSGLVRGVGRFRAVGMVVFDLLLLSHQLGIDTSSRDQFSVISGLNQPAFLQHDDSVCFDHAG